MAFLYVSEYVAAPLPISSAHLIPVGLEPSVAEQQIAIGASSTAGVAFNPLTRFVRVHTDAICSIAFGLSPVAVTTAKRMAANATEYFGVAVNIGHTVAVIANT